MGRGTLLDSSQSVQCLSELTASIDLKLCHAHSTAERNTSMTKCHVVYAVIPAFSEVQKLEGLAIR